MKSNSVDTEFRKEPFNWEAALTSPSIDMNQWETLKSFTESWEGIMYGRSNTVDTIQVSSNASHRLPQDDVLMKLCRLFRTAIHSYAPFDALNIFELILFRTSFVEEAQKSEKINNLKNEIQSCKTQIGAMHERIGECHAALKELVATKSKNSH